MRNHWKLGMLLLSLATVLLAFAAPVAASDVADEAFDAQAAFERLAAMEGTWTGSAKGEEAAEEFSADDVKHTFQVSANGSVVMETMNPGTPHEMINMYTVDGDDLVLTHYCAGGNQPRMRIVASESTADRYVFDFDGGTNLDPAKDPHIHAARLHFLEGDVLDSTWLSKSGGEDAGKMVFHLTRAE